MSLDMENSNISLRICCEDHIENEAYGSHTAYVDLIRFLSKHRRLLELLESITQFLEEINAYQ